MLPPPPPPPLLPAAAAATLSADVVTFSCTESVETVLEALRENSHNGFPIVVNSPGPGGGGGAAAATAAGEEGLPAPAPRRTFAGVSQNSSY
jgi:hypothetical protein